MNRQLPLALSTAAQSSREDFIVAAGNAEAVVFIDSWPNWPVPAAALVGPAGSGKSHLGNAWAKAAHASVVDARVLDDRLAARLPPGPLLIDKVDEGAAAARDTALFSILNRGEMTLFLARQPPAEWPVLLPDLASRFRAMLSLSLWAQDDALLAALTEKLLAERQLRVPDAVIGRILVSLERSPAAIRAFIDRLDKEALAQKRKISLGLVRELLPDAV